MKIVQLKTLVESALERACILGYALSCHDNVCWQVQRVLDSAPVALFPLSALNTMYSQCKTLPEHNIRQLTVVTEKYGRFFLTAYERKAIPGDKDYVDMPRTVDKAVSMSLKASAELDELFNTSTVEKHGLDLDDCSLTGFIKIINSNLDHVNSQVILDLVRYKATHVGCIFSLLMNAPSILHALTNHPLYKKEKRMISHANKAKKEKQSPTKQSTKEKAVAREKLSKEMTTLALHALMSTGEYSPHDCAGLSAQDLSLKFNELQEKFDYDNAVNLLKSAKIKMRPNGKTSKNEILQAFADLAEEQREGYVEQLIEGEVYTEDQVYRLNTNELRNAVNSMEVEVEDEDFDRDDAIATLIRAKVITKAKAKKLDDEELQDLLEDLLEDEDDEDDEDEDGDDDDDWDEEDEDLDPLFKLSQTTYNSLVEYMVTKGGMTLEKALDLSNEAIVRKAFDLLTDGHTMYHVVVRERDDYDTDVLESILNCETTAFDATLSTQQLFEYAHKKLFNPKLKDIRVEDVNDSHGTYAIPGETYFRLNEMLLEAATIYNTRSKRYSAKVDGSILTFERNFMEFSQVESDADATPVAVSVLENISRHAISVAYNDKILENVTISGLGIVHRIGGTVLDAGVLATALLALK